MDYDFSRGQYRRIYSGCIFGRRLNRVGHLAERLFWRIVASCDDFGNHGWDPYMVRHQLVPLVDVSPDDLQRAMRELEAEHLVIPYERAGEPFAHVAGHLELQPSSANGRRVRRCPPSPAEASDLVEAGDAPPAAAPAAQPVVNPGESGCAPKIPERPKNPSATTTTTTTTTKTRGSSSNNGPDTTAAPAAAALLPFPADAEARRAEIELILGDLGLGPNERAPLGLTDEALRSIAETAGPLPTANAVARTLAVAASLPFRNQGWIIQHMLRTGVAPPRLSAEAAPPSNAPHASGATGSPKPAEAPEPQAAPAPAICERITHVEIDGATWDLAAIARTVGSDLNGGGAKICAAVGLSPFCLRLVLRDYPPGNVARAIMRILSSPGGDHEARLWWFLRLSPEAAGAAEPPEPPAGDRGHVPLCFADLGLPQSTEDHKLRAAAGLRDDIVLDVARRLSASPQQMREAVERAMQMATDQPLQNPYGLLMHLVRTGVTPPSPGAQTVRARRAAAKSVREAVESARSQTCSRLGLPADFSPTRRHRHLAVTTEQGDEVQREMRAAGERAAAGAAAEVKV